MDEPKGQSLPEQQSPWSAQDRLPAREMGVILLVLSAYWIGGGSVGLLAASLCHALVVLFLLGLVVLAWPGRWVWIIPSQAMHHPSPPGVPMTLERLFQGSALLLGVILFGADSHPVMNLLAVVLATAGLAALQQDRLRKILTSLALAGLILTAHRLAVLTIPTYWRLADGIGTFLGWFGGALSGQPLEVGATFGGVDFLVLSFAWVFLWRRRTGPLGWKLLPGLVIALFLGHLLYLAGLSWTPILRDILPPPPPRPEYHVYLPPAWSWSEALKSLLPWSFPWVGMGIHLVILGLAMRWIGWPEQSTQQDIDFLLGRSSFPTTTTSSVAAARGAKPPHPALNEIVIEAGPVVLAVLWGFLTCFWGSPGNLAGKKVLAYAPNPQAWSRPPADRYARSDMGRFGMLPELVASLGGRWSFSRRLTEQELQQADLVVLAGDPGPLSQKEADCLQEYVRSGGALLAAYRASKVRSPGPGEILFSELLGQWGIDIRYETATPVWGDWGEAMLPVSHPAAFGLADSRTLLRGASVCGDRPATLELHWPAAAMLVGLWGYGDPGREAARTDFLPQYEPGERLGDVVLAAETRLGSGRVVVLASDDCLRNDHLPASYLFVSRLLGYMAHRGASPADLWRQVLAMITGVFLLGFMAYRPRATGLAWTAAVLGLMLLAGWLRTSQSGRVLPQPPAQDRADATASDPNAVPVSRTDGRGSSSEASAAALTGPRGMPLAYIDASHMEAYSLHPWRPDGLGRLFFSLIQAGYLPLLAPDMKPDRLQTAAVWLSIAPARSFSSSEQAAIQEYVQNGGIFIAMAGAEDAEALRPLLDRWGLRIPRSPVGPGETEPEAEPVGQSPGPEESADNYGRLRTYYINAKDYGRGDYMTAVTLYAPWPVETIRPEGQFPVGDADILVRGYDNVPIVIHRQMGGGGVVVIGDTYFAANKNFDETDGRPTAGMIENAHFWRWMLSRVRRQEEWVPPDPKEWEAQLPPEDMRSESDIPSEPMAPEAP